MKSPFEAETYEDFVKRLTDARRAKQILLDIKHKQMDEEGQYVSYSDRTVYGFDTSEHEWHKQERIKNQRRYSIQRALDEIDYMINKRCHMTRNVPNNIRCSVNQTKKHIISIWMKEMGE